MSADNISEPDEPRIEFDGTPESWLAFQKSTAYFDQSYGLIAVFCPRAISEIAAGGFHVAVHYLLRDDNGTARALNTRFFVPPGPAGEESRKRVVRNIREMLQKCGTDDLVVNLSSLFCKYSHLISLGSHNLVEAIRQVPEGTACCVIGSGQFRFADLELGNDCHRVTNWEIEDSHIQRLLLEVHEVAKQQKLVVLLLCDLADTREPDLRALKELDNVCILRLTRERGKDVQCLNVEEACSLFREGGWERIQGYATRLKLNSVVLGLSLFETFLDTDEPQLAWQAIRPHLGAIGSCPSGGRVQIAKVASEMGETESGEELLRSAIDQGLHTLEEFFLAHLVAEELRLGKVSDELVADMQRRYPGNVLVSKALFHKLFRNRDFHGALRIAEELKTPLQEAQCRGFLSAKLDVRAFLTEAENVGVREEALLSCAEEALFRGRLCHATCWARQIAEDHPLFLKACATRFKVLRVALLKPQHGVFRNELVALMRVVAMRPGNEVLRGELERLMEVALEEPLAHRLLASLLVSAIIMQIRHDEVSIARSREIRQKLSSVSGAQTEEEFSTFFNEFPAALQNGPHVIGQGEIPAGLRHLVGLRLVGVLSDEILDAEVVADLPGAIGALHVLCLCCTQIGEPDVDIQTLQTLIGYHGAMGSAQDARNLAETALQFWSKTQPAYLTWRTAQTWTCCAESFIRANNAGAAARHLVLGMLAHEAPALNVELLRRWYRLGARILRDLNHAELAAMAIRAEESLLKELGGPSVALHRLEVFKLQARLPSVLAGSFQERIELLAEAGKLLDKNVQTEVQPLLSVQANILRLLPRERVPSRILADFERRLGAIGEPLRSILAGAAKPHPSREELISLIRALPDAQSFEDLAYQIGPILPAVCNALKSACTRGDSELFFLAAGVLCQPCLAVQTNQIGHPGAQGEPQPKQASEVVGKIVPSVDIADFRAGRIRQADRYSFRTLANVTLSQLQACLNPTEAVVLLSGEPAGELQGMVVRPDRIEAPRVISTWSSDALRGWRRTYKDALYWHKPTGNLPFDPIKPPVQGISKIFLELQLDFQDLPEQVTIIPPAALFGFTFNLVGRNGKFLIETTNVAIAPSASWLVASRNSAWQGNTFRRAWIGSEKSKDFPLLLLRAMVDPCLKEHGFEISKDFAPVGFSSSQIVFIGAHGGTGLSDYFRRVTDFVNIFAPRDFASFLGGSGCVVLSICSGGRSDRQTGNEETLGLVTDLFRTGVRCVIAPPWPLDMEVTRYWLPSFLRSLTSGKSCGEATIGARAALRAEIDHPCAWGQFHLYGDRNFALGVMARA